MEIVKGQHTSHGIVMVRITICRVVIPPVLHGYGSTLRHTLPVSHGVRSVGIFNGRHRSSLFLLSLCMLSLPPPSC